LQQFLQLYRASMDRLNASDYYYFSPGYFEALCRDLAQQTKLFLVRHHERVVAAALYLVHGDRLHYHLGGSDWQYRDWAANNLLHHAAASWARAAGLRWLHLGGGRSPAPDDSLLRFKASLSADRRQFYTGRRVHWPEAYQALCEAWKRQAGGATVPDYFLLYRQALPTKVDRPIRMKSTVGEP
jgi:lipid II:glycine glycyltransferase (peptidoglycan interpeptide bridge formation enzyme)